MDDDFKDTKGAASLGGRRLTPVQVVNQSVTSTERDTMFARLQEIVLDGLRHGFFECVISCELVKDRKRQVVIKAGKSHQFTIREEDLKG